MREKELLSQLNNLKNIKPDSRWKSGNRDILLSQISAGDCSAEASETKFSVSHYFRNFFHQPALVVAVIVLAVLGGGVFGMASARDAKPGDSLYIAKIISEKAQLAVTFNEKEKAKLGIEFAGNRAKEIAQVLAEEGDGDKEAQVEKLARNFKKEISVAKTRLKNIKVIKDDNSPKETELDSKTEESPEQEDDNQVFSANLGKKDKGVQVYNPSDSAPAVEKRTSVEEALGEAEELFARKDYGAVSDKLEEVKAIIDESADKSDSDSENSATSTEETKVSPTETGSASSTDSDL